MNLIEGLEVTKLRVIDNENGKLFHVLKSHENSFKGFGEVYLSTIKCGKIKAWKKNHKMTCNFTVPVGKIKIVVYDDRSKSKTNGEFNEFILSPDSYSRLTICPGLWYGFSGLGDDISYLVNVADFNHDPKQKIDKKIDLISYKKWLNKL